ncbi:uncharacterized protein LOC130939787 [Arachis stenosperma]|uniref:uncharacterized protein LOC130939787 n=1 Tax=Arachis stenosperma TaxID=217475 RepID=UPI0025AC2EE4|nr:uncharacterized protein LOC130939787 [Arachis stenosperma]
MSKFVLGAGVTIRESRARLDGACAILVASRGIKPRTVWRHRGKASELGLKIVVLGYDLKVYNATHEAMVTRLGCPQVSFRVKQRDFVHYLICLPMTGLDLILRLDWLSKNRVLLNYFEKSLHFMPGGSEGPVVVNGCYLNYVVVNYLGQECQGVMLLAASVSGEEQSLEQIPVVCEFSEVFPDDIKEFPPA